MPSAPASKCLILTPVAHHIDPPCEEGLRALEARGYAVRRVRGYAAIDQARSQLASDALAEGYDEIMWIDADMGFDPDDVEKLRSHPLPIVCGIGVKKGHRALACHVLPGTTEVIFGRQGGLVEVLYAGAAFLLTRREVYETISARLELPTCNQRFERTLTPYFMPLIVPDPPHGAWYLGEDYAFCHRARQCGYKIMADTTIRLRHYGSYGFTWEDAGTDRERFGTYVLRLG